MRPTPAETIAGVRRILLDVVEPEVGSEYARARLREVRAVLAQIDWDDAALHLRTATQRQVELLDELRDWAAAPERVGFGAVGTVGPAEGASFAELDAAHTEVAATLVRAVRQLGEWLRDHPDDGQARWLHLRLVRALAAEPG